MTDIGTILYGRLSFSRLEELAVVAHIGRMTTSFASALCSETLHRLSCSRNASIYFIESLQVDECGFWSTGMRQGRNCSLDAFNGPNRENIICETTTSPDPPLSNELEGLKSVILRLDSNINNIMNSIQENLASGSGSSDGDDDDVDSLTLISPLIDTLKLCITSLLGKENTIGSLKGVEGQLRLKSPTTGFCLLLEALFAVCNEKESSKRDAKFWAAIASLSEYFYSTKSVDFFGEKAVESSIDAVGRMSNSNVLRLSCDVLCIFSNTIHGLCDMKVNLIKSCESTSTQLLLQQIRKINYSSPVVIPNSSTKQGNYNLGFWIKIPSNYSQSSESRPAEKGSEENGRFSGIKTHILSRVPEAGEVDMTSLFKVSYCCFFQDYVYGQLIMCI